MILIIGGLGFVGSNTAEALVKLGYDCIVTSHNTDQAPDFLTEQVGKHVVIEPADVTDLASLLAIGRKHKITGIINLLTGGGFGAGPDTPATELVADLHTAITSVANAMEAARQWGVKRVTLVGAPVIYNGVATLPWREDATLPLTASFGMEAGKKISEIIASYLEAQTKIECVTVRLASMYGPGYDPTRSSVIGRLVHAAAQGVAPDFTNHFYGSIYAEDAGDQCYIKDAARAIALVQTAPKLNHRVYNASSGRPVSNQDVLKAVKLAVPGFVADLPAGHQPGLPASSAAWYFDINRVQADTGYEPQFDLEHGVADYLAWLKAGHER